MSDTDNDYTRVRLDIEDVNNTIDGMSVPDTDIAADIEQAERWLARAHQKCLERE